mmetsp:Transcript_65192/g.117320  ORF Transcript_65192/g.117320 Transcript_65192/m.117320 type:complete len:180 (-) Transcript_65192:732-1271(-)
MDSAKSTAEGGGMACSSAAGTCHRASISLAAASISTAAAVGTALGALDSTLPQGIRSWGALSDGSLAPSTDLFTADVFHCAASSSAPLWAWRDRPWAETAEDGAQGSKLLLLASSALLQAELLPSSCVKLGLPAPRPASLGRGPAVSLAAGGPEADGHQPLEASAGGDWLRPAAAGALR